MSAMKDQRQSLQPHEQEQIACRVIMYPSVFALTVVVVVVLDWVWRV